MKFKAKNLNAKKLLNGNTEISVEIDDTKNKIITQLSNTKQLLNSDLEVDIEKFRHRRSLGHNRLFWDMCNYLADHINDTTISANVIYKNLIMEYGISTIYPVKDELVDMVVRDWESRGDGWLTQKLSKSKLDGNYTNIKFWFGSSVYNSKQFWRLVEGLKIECSDYRLDISFYDKEMQSIMAELEKKEKEIQYGDNQRQLCDV